MYQIFSFYLTGNMRSIKRKDDDFQDAGCVSSASQLSDELMVHIFADFPAAFLKYLPLRTLSRLWGFMTSLKLPIFMRTIVIGCYSRFFGCKIHEAEVQDLKEYSCLRDFFARSLKPGLRPIFPGNCIVSPVDGRILHFCKVENGLIEQVKGVNFTLPAFLGPLTWKNDLPSAVSSLNEYQEVVKTYSDTCLYNCVIYLAPGDYHRFHSPAKWSVHFRRHFPGQLLSVSPSFVGRIKGLFAINERVCYYGSWSNGFFSMTAVGATNVGSVKAYFDSDLRTNRPDWRNYSRKHDKSFETPIDFDKGDAFGEFNLGSTIVLLFEAPKNWRFNVKAGDIIKYGQLLMVPKNRLHHHRRLSPSNKKNV